MMNNDKLRHELINLISQRMNKSRDQLLHYTERLAQLDASMRKLEGFIQGIPMCERTTHDSGD
ncbi:hypothetical protein PsorP6_007748 [Peronosclerospora sorghi]|uniref:Uncharacterized protein n=1 Tax=Peronosclerospora sorghi TaxID=230839 RepID=A0ACC0W9Z3_9STRA|nr:hypothetical protein PsorP6_007748 [Peronosclerospora sorghi]